MFVPRMWSDEVERIGKQKCTPAGYALHVVGDLIGSVGLLMLLAAPVYLVYRRVVGTFHGSLLWLFVGAFAMGLIGSIIVAISWAMAERKKFHYDYERRESTWIEAGEKRSYTLADCK